MYNSSLPRAISIDCEMVGCGTKGEISILGRIAVVNDRMELLMDAFVRPSRRVTNFRTRWSGLTWNVLKNGEPFESIRSRFLQIVDHYKKTSSAGLVFVGHDVSNDFKVIEWSPSDSDIRDTSTYVPLRKTLVKILLEKGEIDSSQKDSLLKQKPSLKTLSKFILNRNIQQGSHCPREDAMSAMMLYLKVRDRWESSILCNKTIRISSLNSNLDAETDNEEKGRDGTKDRSNHHSTPSTGITCYEMLNSTLTPLRARESSSLRNVNTSFEKKNHSKKNISRCKNSKKRSKHS
ncbi:hypothetical protein RS030_6847 [Cryptosporidium xiaoi]|uniref:RNA exonuclease 4 n=1 Tax=Cryptosporidium xiaoi TaxID=659607 RepID=A0AAV9XUK5_9CRYT